MDDLLSGLVVAVSQTPVGAQLAGDAATGETVLLLDDTIDMYPTGGQVTIDGTVTDYESSDDDASTLTLAAPLAAPLVEGTELLVHPPKVEATAMVLVGGGSDPVPATVPHNMQDALPVGVREEEDREHVRLVRDGEWSFTVFDLVNHPLQQSLLWEADDVHVLTAGNVTAGTVTFPLSHRPEAESLVAFWGGVPQEPTEYTVDLDAATVTWPLAGFEEVGDRLWVHYAYRVLETPPGDTAPEYGDVESLVQRGVYTGPGGLVPLPAGTQVGDVIVALACGVNDGGKNDTVLSGAIADDRMTDTFGSPSGRTWWGQVTNLDPLNIDIPVGGWAIFATYGSADPADTLLLTEVEITSNVDEDGATGHMVTFVHAPRSWSSVVVAIIEDLGLSSDPPLFPGFTGSVDDRDLGLQYWTGSPPSPEIVWADDDNYQRYDRTLITMSVVRTS